MSNNNETSATIGFGLLFAGFVSYVMNGFLWSVLHAFFGWFYIIYLVIFRSTEIVPAFRAFFGF